MNNLNIRPQLLEDMFGNPHDPIDLWDEINTGYPTRPDTSQVDAMVPERLMVRVPKNPTQVATPYSKPVIHR